MFLGERLDFRLGRAFPSEISKSQIVSALQDVLRDGGLHAIKAESLLDLRSVPFPTVSLGWLYLRLFQMGGNQGGSAGETVDELDSSDKDHGETSVKVDNPIRPGDRGRVSSSSS